MYSEVCARIWEYYIILPTRLYHVEPTDTRSVHVCMMAKTQQKSIINDSFIRIIAAVYFSSSSIHQETSTQGKAHGFIYLFRQYYEKWHLHALVYGVVSSRTIEHGIGMYSPISAASTISNTLQRYVYISRIIAIYRSRYLAGIVHCTRERSDSDGRHISWDSRE